MTITRLFGNITGNSKASTTAVTSATVGTTAAIGSTILAWVSSDPAGGVITSVTDTKSNTYAKLTGAAAVNGSGTSGVQGELWASVITVALASGDTVTANFTSSVVAKILLVSGWAGCTATVDVTTQTAVQASANPSVAITPSTAGCLVFAGMGVEDGTGVANGSAPASGFTTDSADWTGGGLTASNIEAVSEYVIQTSATTATFAPTITGGPNSAIVLVALRPSGATVVLPDRAAPRGIERGIMRGVTK